MTLLLRLESDRKARKATGQGESKAKGEKDGMKRGGGGEGGKDDRRERLQSRE